jgi:hypothetical protein
MNRLFVVVLGLAVTACSKPYSCVRDENPST